MQPSSNLSKPNPQDYQPNFILVGQKTAVFGDIIPIYKSYHELSTTIVSSWESLARLVWQSRVFLVCVFSLLSELLHNTIYQTILVCSVLYEQATHLPEKYNQLRNQLTSLIYTLSNQKTRGLWWLDIKLEIKKFISDVEIIARKIFHIFKKIYLSVVVLSVLLIISSANLMGNPTNQGGVFSVLGKALNNHTQTSNQQLENSYGIVSVISLLQQEGKTSDKFILERVVQHRVLPGDTIDSISEMYGLNPETVLFNNQLEESQPLPDTLYLPWTDGYIYRAESDISLQDLERIYGVAADLLYSENEDLLNREKGVFEKGSLILIPTRDFGSIANSNKLEAQRIENLRRAEEQKRKPNPAGYSAVTNQTYAGSYSGETSLGFIWPTSGNISRCVQAYHIACDIANFSAPPVFSVQSGYVAKVGFEAGGYGHHIIIDHGNGVRTLYAHLSEVYVSGGQTVIQGQSIGRMGATGYATGIHLHFEVIVNGQKRNPLLYLP